MTIISHYQYNEYHITRILNDTNHITNIMGIYIYLNIINDQNGEYQYITVMFLGND